MENKNFKYAEIQLEKEEKRNLSRYYKVGTIVHKFFRANCNGIVYTFEDEHRGTKRYLALGFKGNSIKRNFYLAFQNEEKRTAHIEKYFEVLAKVTQRKKEAVDKKRELKKAMAEKISIGTILHGSWGYEQTNPEFYQVVDRPSDFQAIIREIGHTRVSGSEGFDCCQVKPLKDNFIGEPLKKMIQPCGISFSLFNLSPCDPNKEFYKSWGY